MGLVETEVEAAPVERNMDGYAYSYTDPKKGTYLVVLAPQGDGKAVEYAMVERELKKMAIPGIDWSRVKQAVNDATGKAFRIIAGPDPDEEEAKRKAAEEEAAANAPIDKSSYVFLTITDDAVSATITLVPPPLEERERIDLNMDDVPRVMDDNGIVFGIIEERMAEVEDVLDRIRDGEQAEPVAVEIAHGVEAQDGQDVRYEWFFDAEGKGGGRARVAETEDGRVDHFAVKEIGNTTRGQLVARRLAATLGTSGKSIRGEEITAKDGGEGAIVIGRGVEHALGNADILVAGVDGQVKFNNNTVEVLALYEVEGDVDVSTGSIDFIGSVVVRGNVQPGLKITAKEDVMIDGVVDDAEIHSEGSVTIKGGVLGQGQKAKIVAGKDINAKYFRNATIECKGALTGSEGILHCKVTAYSVKLTGRRGQIVGGEIMAESEISANTIGSNTMATPTLLTVGESLARRDEINQLTGEVRKLEDDLDKTKKALKVLKDQQEKGGTLSGEKKAMLAKLTRAQYQMIEDLKPAQEKLRKITAEEEEQRKHIVAKISALGTIYPGVKVAIRNAKKHIVEEQRYCTLTENGSEVRVGSYK